MVDRIQSGIGGARALIEAAQQRHADALARATASVDASASTEATSSNFQSSLIGSLKDVDAQVKQADLLAEGLITGKVKDFHEVAAVLKQSELSLKFSLEVRNKFVDAYREIMRMTV